MEDKDSRSEVFICGIGIISFGSGIIEETETPCLKINHLNEQKNKKDYICEDDLNKNKKEVKIYFKNLEGLEILELHIKRIKEILIKQKNY